MWTALLIGLGLLAVSGALLTLRLRRRGHAVCLRVAGLDDHELAELGRAELASLEDELHDCARQSDPATATAIRGVLRRIGHALAEVGSAEA